MLSLRRALSHPQVISTNRHIMQGYLDLVGDQEWDHRSATLRGRSRVVGGDRYEVVVATNGYRALSARSSRGRVELVGSGGVVRLRIDAPTTGVVAWQVRFGDSR